jgi:hypothetical protein
LLSIRVQYNHVGVAESVLSAEKQLQSWLGAGLGSLFVGIHTRQSRPVVLGVAVDVSFASSCIVK